jgi:hypothetical protein
VPSAYQVAPIFLIRLAGVPFEKIEQLATRKTSAIARELVSSRSRLTPDKEPALLTSLRDELQRSRTSLLNSAATVIPPYLIFAGEGMRERTASLIGEREKQHDGLLLRNSRTRERERHLLLYLQRIAAKNDTFGQFGPSAWGVMGNATESLHMDIVPGVSAREAFLERWTAHAVATVINADPAIQPEFCPRLNPNGRIEGSGFVFLGTGETAALSDLEHDVLKRCDGRTPVHSLGASSDIVKALVEKGILISALEVPAMEPYAFTVLLNDVRQWRPGPVRDNWLSILQAIAGLPEAFVTVSGTKERQAIIDDARARLRTLGAIRKAGDRFLYAASNPIGEECLRKANFTINADLINEVVSETQPWIDFWRDSYAFIASRVAAGLRQVMEKAGAKSGPLPLPAFLRVCEAAKLPLTGPGLVAFAVMAFQEVKAAFRQRLQPHVHLKEYELTLEDCHVVRNSFKYPSFDEYTYPSADLQISAESPEAVARDDYKWILAELHPAVALLHHCMYWSCPDKPALNEALADTACNRPNFHFGFYAADFTSHTTVRLFDALPDLSYFVAPQRGNPDWRSVPPSQAEVYVDPESGDVCLRRIDSHEYLGSFARNWIIPLGFHPFQFGIAPHTPRLRCGKVIVQRRSWTVTLDELGKGDFTGVSKDLVLAVERLRAARDLPRFVYIRPTEQALRRSGAEGRDKDTKPVFIDLESYLFLEIFHRWLTKAGEIEVTEMLPNPEHLLWKEPDGRHTFELRTLIVPRS